MFNMKKMKITKAQTVRLVADAALINVAFIAALALRFFLFVAMRHQTQVDYENEFWSLVTAYWQNAIPLTLVSLVVYSLSGFYTYSRVYQGRYKALVVAQAVAHSYLIYGVAVYFLADRLDMVEIPRIAFVMAWLMNTGLTLASRTWTSVWEKVVRPERDAKLRDVDSKVRSVLVIGGAGYIGSALLPKLLEKGYRVRVLDMFLFGQEPIAKIANHKNLELVKGDFRHVEKVVEAMRGMDAVVHLGAIVGDPACNLDERVTVAVNLSATQMIAQVAKASGIRRFIFASTCSVYGACDELLDERSEVEPISLYGHTKLAAENGLKNMADANFAPTLLRFATIYGLSGRTRFDLVINVLSAKAKVDGQITVHGGGQWRPFVHVDDAALGVFTALEAPLSVVGNQTFNVGSDEQNHTIGEIGQMVKDQVFTAELICEESNTDNRNYRVSFQKIRNLLGFTPAWTIESGISQVLEAVASGEVQDYRDDKYSNVKFLSGSGVIELVRADDDWSKLLNETSDTSQVPV